MCPCTWICQRIEIGISNIRRFCYQLFMYLNIYRCSFRSISSAQWKSCLIIHNNINIGTSYLWPLGTTINDPWWHGIILLITIPLMFSLLLVSIIYWPNNQVAGDLCTMTPMWRHYNDLPITLISQITVMIEIIPYYERGLHLDVRLHPSRPLRG